ncbi:hypothetical protein NT6N_01050 [Oceaniferula spumae]|uniref:Uncharacterized protein n=1 Tax=Oceaniferula spumae TaxID=2979115 RepID=A0AAT9FGG3_9BACT
MSDHDLQPGNVPMHDAKGLEFRSVAIVACNEEVIPSKPPPKQPPSKRVNSRYSHASISS